METLIRELTSRIARAQYLVQHAGMSGYSYTRDIQAELASRIMDEIATIRKKLTS